MKKFIVKILILSLPIVLIGFILEYAIRSIPNDYLYKKEYLDTHSHEIQTLILGSSHSFYGINPICFNSRTFNASHVSQTLNYDLEIFKLYYKDFSKLETVILPISYFTLFSKLEQEVESWRCKNYVIYYGVDTANSIEDYSFILSNSLKQNIISLRKFYLSKKTKITCSKLGWGTTYNSKKNKDLEKYGKIAALRHTKDNYRNLKDNISTLNSILELCNNKGVKVLLFTPPAYKTYRGNLNKEQLDITIEIVEKLEIDYPNVKYINLLNNNKFKYFDFYDADHLNELGSAKLSNLLDRKYWN